MPSLIEQLRAIDLPMGGRSAPWEAINPETDEPYMFRLYVGWTTDSAKADAARELGATVTGVAARDPKCSGWEVTIRDPA